MTGLRADDVITKINGDDATSNIQLQELTLTKKPGGTVYRLHQRWQVGNDNGHIGRTAVTGLPY